MSPGDRAGVSVVEMLVALLLTGLVVRAGWSALAGHRRAAQGVTLGAEAHEVGRTVRWILTLELRSGVPGVDWRVHQEDSLTLRAFRGTGSPCGGSRTPSRRWVVAYRGIRAPNPAKDSVLVLLAEGRWEVAQLLSAARWDSPCPVDFGGDTYRLSLDREVTKPALVRIFERGSYHVARRAFRYRTGLGGRQPLTPERLTARSGLEDRGDKALLFLDYRWIEGISRPWSERWSLRSLSR